MISLSYVPVEFNFHFAQNMDETQATSLAFVLRSVLGYNLRSMACISHKNQCPDCMYYKTCAYSYIFETIISQNNEVHSGTNRASHPFIFSKIDYTTVEKGVGFGTDISFTVTLLGKAISFLPYIYAAFSKAGDNGLFKERIQYEIKDVIINGESILIDKNNLNTDFESCLWKYSPEQKGNPLVEKEILIELKTPLRFKSNGQYTMDFTSLGFMNCLFRRLKACCVLYGIFEDDFLYNGKYLASTDLTIVERNLKWVDSPHYSSRQKNSMELGGLTGTFKMRGPFSEFDLALLDFATIFNAGKNTNFGLGRIDYWCK